jgi:hypothetical protein
VDDSAARHGSGGFAVHHMCLEAQLITKADRPLI